MRSLLQVQEKASTITLYAAGAVFAALGLAYIFGPSVFPDDIGYQQSKAEGAVGLSNPANDCFINSVLQALAGLSKLRRYLEELAGPQIQDAKDDDSQVVPSSGSESAQGRRPSEWSEVSARAIVSAALREMLAKLSERPAYRKTISARNFIVTLERAYNASINRHQQDAQEFLQVVVEKLDDEHQAMEKASSSSSSSSSTSDLSKNQRDGGSAMTNPMFPLTGTLSSQIECLTCHFKPPSTKSTFLTLTLNVPHTSFSTTLDACLDGLLKVENIEDYKCARCAIQQALRLKQIQLTRDDSQEDLAAEVAKLEDILNTADADAIEKASDAVTKELSNQAGVKLPQRRIQKYVSISDFPDVLAIHLSRSIFDPSSFSTKNMAKVEFPEVLTLGAMGERRRKYKLCTMITHRGGHNSGHYETYRRQPPPEERKSISEAAEGGEAGVSEPAIAQSREGDETKRPIKKKNRTRPKSTEKWWRISDDKISECKTKDMLNMQKEVYILFYELQN